MFPVKRERPKRPPWPTLAALFVLVVLGELFRHQTEKKSEGVRGLGGEVTRLTAPRRSPDADGRTGDLVLTGPDGASLTVVAAPNIAGHRPMLGAIVDVATVPGDVTDPLMWLRTSTVDAAGKLAELAERSPQPFTCSDGGAGVRAYGAYGVGMTAEICAREGGRFAMKTVVTSLPGGAVVVDELNVGSRPIVVEGVGAAWGTEADTGFVAAAHGGVALLIEAPKMHATRSFSVFGAEIFPSPVRVRYGLGDTATRTLHVLRGDVLHALARLPGSKVAFDVGFGPDRGGEISVRDAADREIAVGTVARGETRQVKLPQGFGDHLTLRDDRGVVTDGRVPMPASGASVRAAVAGAGTVALAYTDAAGAPLPVHVLVRGQGGTPDPVVQDADGRTVKAGRSVYLLDGAAHVSLAPGQYRLTASHGMTHTLVVSDVTVRPSETASVTGTLRAVVDTKDWVAADFHLHSAPSPDSDVSLEERVESLACEGVELAVATDHNRVADLEPAARGLGLDSRLATARGVEISTFSPQRWGHFNAYPLPSPKGAPEEGVPAYFDKLPGQMFASARELGARVIQVNHARMAPGIGYFDLAHLDPKTGRASGEFSPDFDAFEAFNGMWIERREKIREGPVDLVALARRGKRVAALGNSDSHKLLYEEPGYPRTFVHTPSAPAATRFERVVGVLLGSRDTTVTSGPFVEMTVDGQAVGSTVTPGPSGVVRVRVRVSAPAWVPVEHVEIWHDDLVAARFAVDGPARDGVRFEGEFDLPTSGVDATVLAWAEADAPLPDVLPYAHPLSIGFTGVVYVDGDHDGKLAVPAAP